MAISMSGLDARLSALVFTFEKLASEVRKTASADVIDMMEEVASELSLEASTETPDVKAALKPLARALHPTIDWKD